MLKRFARLTMATIIIGCFGEETKAQTYKDGKIWLNEDGSNYFKFTLAAQLWVRNTDMNPGTTINNYRKDNYTDIGIRRLRLQAYGQIADRVFIYTQLGQNNFNFLSDRKAGFFVHDALGEYEVVKSKLSLGAGLTGWSGLARFASPSMGTIMGIDAPLFLQTTNDVNDQFLRKLSVYAKGKLGKLDYRVVMTNPMAVQKATGYSTAIGGNSTFSAMPAKLQWQGYFQWQFLDQESNLTPYTSGTYLGAKKVFNIGAGFIYQPKAMWHQEAGNDTVQTAMKHLAVDVFYDAPLNTTTGTALSVYAAYVNMDFGPGYLRNQATMNPANGNEIPTVLNGSGNGYPAFGTGNVLYAQVGYKFRNNLIGKTTLMPYAGVQRAHYDRLGKDMNFWDGGVNWLLKGHTSKLTLAYHYRPVYETVVGQKAALTGHKGSVLLQYQVFLN